MSAPFFFLLSLSLLSPLSSLPTRSSCFQLLVFVLVFLFLFFCSGFFVLVKQTKVWSRAVVHQNTLLFLTYSWSNLSVTSLLFCPNCLEQVTRWPAIDYSSNVLKRLMLSSRRQRNCYFPLYIPNSHHIGVVCVWTCVCACVCLRCALQFCSPLVPFIFLLTHHYSLTRTIVLGLLFSVGLLTGKGQLCPMKQRVRLTHTTSKRS